jgi:hypothetical protein
MPFADYNELKAAVLAYLIQDDVGAQVEDLIRLAEARISQEVQIRQLLKQQVGGFVGDGVALPADYVSTAILRVTDTTPDTVMKRYHQSEFYGLGVHQAGGVPRVFTTIGSRIVVAPPVAGGLSRPFIHDYYGDVPPLTSTNTTNAVLTHAPNLYLYATLVEAEPFLANDERVEVWIKMYERARQSVISVEARGRYRPYGVMRPQSLPNDGKSWRSGI